MSLFGSPTGSPSVPPLFRDDDDSDDHLILGADTHRASSQPVNVGGAAGGLFDDVGDGDIWALPAPRSRSVGPGMSGSGSRILGATGGGVGGDWKSVVKTLVNEGNSSLPPVYAQVYDRVVIEYPAGGFGPGISAVGVKRVLEEAGLSEDEGAGRRIKESVVGIGGIGADAAIGKGEFNVLMAMIGLAQEGREISIDEVDDRRRNLPIPKLKTLLPNPQYSEVSQNGNAGFDPPDIQHLTPGTSAASSALGHNPDTHISTTVTNTKHNLNSITDSTTTNLAIPTILHHSYSSPASTTNPQSQSAKSTTVTQRSRIVSGSTIYTRSATAVPDPTEQDPWGSPTMHSNHAHANQQPAIAKNNPIAIPQAVVAAGFGPNMPPDDYEPDHLQSALRAHSAQPRASSAVAWGGYDGAVGPQLSRVGTGVLSGYGAAAETAGFGGLASPSMGVNRMGSFGGIGGGSLSMGGAPQRVERSGLSTGGVRAEESVTITVLPEKEGMFLFQHRNYQISSGRRASRVVRRYSDFVWLLDCLHKRYPFRCLPLLPPKRIAVNGYHLSADATFLENRRRGLIRFTNFLIRHPVLSQEQLVIMFLTVPTELSVWRKQATISVIDEYISRLQSLTPTQVKEIESNLPPNLEQTFETVRSGLRKSAEIYIGLCSLVERMSKRQEGFASELSRFATALDSLTDVSEATYAVDTGDIPGLNEGLHCVERFLGNAQGLMVDEAKGWEEGLLEDLKRQRDGIVAMREMFDRRERMSGDQVPQLEKRITAAEKKIEIIKARPDPPSLNGNAGSAGNGGGGGGSGGSGISSGLSALAGTGGTAATKDTDIAKLQTQIKKDRETIVECLARRVLIKEGLRDELRTFHNSQYHVARLHQDWAMERVKYAELMAENWKGLQTILEAMPTGE